MVTNKTKNTNKREGGEMYVDAIYLPSKKSAFNVIFLASKN